MFRVTYSQVITFWLLMLPIWWLLGVEQFIYSLLFITLACLRSGPHPHQHQVVLLQQLLGVFIVLHLISGAFIIEPLRYVTFARALMLYITAFLVLHVMVRHLHSFTEVRGILRAVVIAIGCSALAGLAVVAHGALPPPVVSPFGSLLPPSIAATGYGQNIIFRSLAREGWFSMLGGSYLRLSGFFMYATMFGPALVLGIILTIYLFQHSRRRGRLLYGGFIVAMGAALVFTTARASMLSLVGTGILWMVLFPPPGQGRGLRMLIGTTLCIMALVLAPFYLDLAAISHDILYARGGGSIVSRLGVYRATLAGFWERPIFGWGTERDVPNLTFPAGSHSYIFGVLYRYGAAGLAVFLAIWLVLWRTTGGHGLSRKVGHIHPEMLDLLRYGKWILMALSLNSITNALDVCGVLFVLMWVTFGCMTVTQRMLRREAAEARSLLPDSPPVRHEPAARSAVQLS